MKPCCPDSIEQWSDKCWHLSIPMQPETPTFSCDDEFFEWPEIPNARSKLIVFNQAKEQVVFLGGLGDPGLGLGRVSVHELTGAVLAQIELSKRLPDWGQLSRKWSKLSNFPWIAAYRLGELGSALSIWVCKAYAAVIDLNDFTMSLEPNKRGSAWGDVNGVYSKGVFQELGCVIAIDKKESSHCLSATYGNGEPMINEIVVHVH